MTATTCPVCALHDQHDAQLELLNSDHHAELEVLFKAAAGRKALKRLAHNHDNEYDALLDAQQAEVYALLDRLDDEFLAEVAV